MPSPTQAGKKVILTDIDGVVIQWESGLPYFAQKYNLDPKSILDLLIKGEFMDAQQIFNCGTDRAYALMEKYNKSDFIRYLASYSDALAVINELKEEYDFVAITALGTDIDAQLNREFNLHSLFPGAFKEVMMCDHGATKFDLLFNARMKYEDRIVCYIDDLPHHVLSAHEALRDYNIAGCINRPSLFHMNRTEQKTNHMFTVVNNWYQIKEFLKCN